MKNLYLILLIVVIVGIVAIFALTFLAAGDQNLTGASIWGGGVEYDCLTASGDTVGGGCGTNTNSPEATRCRNSGGTCQPPG